AWLVAVHRFPGRNALVWMLALPLAIPAYVSGFVWVDTLGVRTLAMAAVVLTLSLYPYVYVLALAAFRDQPAGAWNSARTLGCRPGEAFRRVALPAARPAVLAGTVLVALEVLTDVGTVRLFNVQTVADGVFRVWFGLAQREAATELAGLLLLAAAALLLAERRAGRRAGAGPVAGGRDLRRVEPAPLTGSGWLGVAGAVVVVGAALVFPLVRLASWAAEAVGRGATASAAGGLGHHLGSTLRVTAATVLVCTAVGVVVALATRWVRGRGTRTLATVTTLGYGLPGPVIALGVLVVLAAVDRTGWLPRGTLLVGSFLGLVAALVVRYLALAVKPAEQAVGRVGRSAEDAARMLGAGPGRVVGRVQLPLARGGLAVAAALVALDVVKELPATLLLRPFGVDTLPVWVWQASSDSRWAEAGLPSLVLVLVAAVPTAVLLRSMLRGRAVAW
ncbi:MAG: ABC transporter permease, partial [Microthrixaceae bacterium]